MIEAIEVLLQQWGAERAAPAWEAPVRSPLGDAEQWMGGGRATGGAAGLGPLVAYAERSRLYQLVDEALRSMADDRECGGLGGRGRVLYALARVRYVHAGGMPSVAAQLVELGISERTYRSQVAELHRAVAERLACRLRGGARVAAA